LAELETFWESEVPRIGEPGALGWRSFATNEALEQDLEPKSDESQDDVDPSKLFESWSTIETIAAIDSPLPARTIDDVTEDDPFRVILFSDIKDWMVYFRIEDDHESFFNAFLAFVGLPSLAIWDYSIDTGQWWTDSFVRNRESIGKQNDNDPATSISMPMTHYRISVDALFTDKRNLFSTWSDRTSAADCLSQTKYAMWTRNVLGDIFTSGNYSQQFAEYYLAFDFITNAER
jgi:hypothetical protein